MKDKNKIIDGLGTTIFTVMSALATKHDAINLGQGLPEGDGPDDLKEMAAQYTVDGPNQYPPSPGLPELRQAVADNNRRFYGIEAEWQSQVLVTSGATEALTDCILAITNPGDEIVLIEPFYDSYLPIVELAGAIPRFVRLHAPNWHLDEDELRSACSSKTKAIIINSPMNPTGKVFSLAELQIVARIVEEFDLYAICDEVYEHLTFGDNTHIPLMTLPGMADRCVRVGSAGKTFSVTGWKVGYITGPAHLIEVIAKAHQFITFTTPPNLQRAVAWGLQKDDDYFAKLSATLEGKRDKLSTGLANMGFNVMPCGGTYFVTTDITPLGFAGTDAEFCIHITEQAGVAAIPLSPFYGPEAATSFVRFCFSKQDEMLDDAILRLGGLFSLA
jgi:N-succinyldiaminopimelate aminotransferase